MSGKIKAAVITAFCLILVITLLIGGSKSFVSVDAGEIVVVQSPFKGELTFHNTPGMKWQGFGSVTRYHKRSQFWFSSKSDQGNPKDESITVRFNDGAHAQISGSLSWEMPHDQAMLEMIHSKYGSHAAIEQQLIRTALEKSIFMTGPLMSSAESYAARRNDMLSLIDDQFVNGVYRTEIRETTMTDPVTKETKRVKLVEPIKGADGKIQREDVSVITTYGIKTNNLSLNQIKYDESVEKQISKQQEAIMEVQTSIAHAKTAE